MKMDRVEDRMTRDVAVIHQSSDVHEVEKRLLEKNIHGLPVVDDEDRLVGVVSQTDLLAWHFNTGVDGASFYDSSIGLTREGLSEQMHVNDIRTASISEVMSPLVHCIRADRPIAVAASTMIRQRIHRLVVVDDEMHVQGILSALDVLYSVPGVVPLVGSRPEPAAVHTEGAPPPEAP